MPNPLERYQIVDAKEPAGQAGYPWEVIDMATDYVMCATPTHELAELMARLLNQTERNPADRFPIDIYAPKRAAKWGYTNEEISGIIPGLQPIPGESATPTEEERTDAATESRQGRV